MKQTREKELLRASEAVLPEGSEHGRQQENENSSNVSRTYKARLFAMIFSNKEELLKLYNAVNQTNYKDPELLTVNTLENAIYMGMRNDVSYLLYDRLSLYEHQASINPNMPLRNLFYVSDIYSGLTKDTNLYGSKLIRLPEPQFVVFYNGADELPERSILRLSDAFSHKGGEPKLELEVLVLNINPGFNLELMEHCRTLREYMAYVDTVRKYARETDFPEAVDRAIRECLAKGILADFLSRNWAEVKKVSIYEYDEEKHIRQEREDAMEEGLQQGMQRGLQRGETLKLVTLVLKKYAKGLSPKETADMLEEELPLIEEIYSLKQSCPDWTEREIVDKLLSE